MTTQLNPLMGTGICSARLVPHQYEVGTLAVEG